MTVYLAKANWKWKVSFTKAFQRHSNEPQTLLPSEKYQSSTLENGQKDQIRQPKLRLSKKEKNLRRLERKRKPAPKTSNIVQKLVSGIKCIFHKFSFKRQSLIDSTEKEKSTEFPDQLNTSSSNTSPASITSACVTSSTVTEADFTENLNIFPVVNCVHTVNSDHSDISVDSDRTECSYKTETSDRSEQGSRKATIRRIDIGIAVNDSDVFEGIWEAIVEAEANKQPLSTVPGIKQVINYGQYTFVSFLNNETITYERLPGSAAESELARRQIESDRSDYMSSETNSGVKLHFWTPVAIPSVSTTASIDFTESTTFDDNNFNLDEVSTRPTSVSDTYMDPKPDCSDDPFRDFTCNIILLFKQNAKLNQIREVHFNKEIKKQYIRHSKIDKATGIEFRFTKIGTYEVRFPCGVRRRHSILKDLRPGKSCFSKIKRAYPEGKYEVSLENQLGSVLARIRAMRVEALENESEEVKELRYRQSLRREEETHKKLKERYSEVQRKFCNVDSRSDESTNKTELELEIKLKLDKPEQHEQRDEVQPVRIEQPSNSVEDEKFQESEPCEESLSNTDRKYRFTDLNDYIDHFETNEESENSSYSRQENKPIQFAFDKEKDIVPLDQLCHFTGNASSPDSPNSSRWKDAVKQFKPRVKAHLNDLEHDLRDSIHIRNGSQRRNRVRFVQLYTGESEKRVLNDLVEQPVIRDESTGVEIGFSWRGTFEERAPYGYKRHDPVPLNMKPLKSCLSKYPKKKGIDIDYYEEYLKKKLTELDDEEECQKKEKTDNEESLKKKNTEVDEYKEWMEIKEDRDRKVIQERLHRYEGYYRREAESRVRLIFAIQDHEQLRKKIHRKAMEEYEKRKEEEVIRQDIRREIDEWRIEQELKRKQVEKWQAIEKKWLEIQRRHHIEEELSPKNPVFLWNLKKEARLRIRKKQVEENSQNEEASLT